MWGADARDRCRTTDYIEPAPVARRRVLSFRVLPTHYLGVLSICTTSIAPDCLYAYYLGDAPILFFP